MAILNSESSLMEIVKLIGSDVLPDDQKLTLEIARVIRLGFLQQNAFHPDDTCVSLEKQFKMMEVILYLYKKCRALIAMGMPMSVLKKENIFEKIIAIKYDVPNDHLEMMDDYKKAVKDFYNTVMERMDKEGLIYGNRIFGLKRNQRPSGSFRRSKKTPPLMKS